VDTATNESLSLARSTPVARLRPAIPTSNEVVSVERAAASQHEHKSASDRVIIASEYYTHVMSGYYRFLAILHPLHRRSQPSPQLLLPLPYLLSFHTSVATLLIPILHVSSKQAFESRSRSALRPDALDRHSPCLMWRIAPSSRCGIPLQRLGVAPESLPSSSPTPAAEGIANRRSVHSHGRSNLFSPPASFPNLFGAAILHFKNFPRPAYPGSSFKSKLSIASCASAGLANVRKA